MAVGYSGPRGQTMLLTVNSSIGGTDQNVYIHTIMNDVKPMLKAPFILNLIRNTNSANAHSEFANTRYYYNMKKSSATLISDSDNPLATDPRNLASENVKLLVKQIAPVEYAKKLSGAFRDLELQGAENTAAVAVADFIEQRRLEKQMNLWVQAINAAGTVQKNSTSAATTFKDGAHYVNATYSTSDDIYNDLVAAINSFQTFGLTNSKLQYNQNIPYIMGITRNDMIIVISPTAASLLFKTPGLYASDSGNELFRKANLKEFLGVPLYIDATLPAGTNFMILTTGYCGALAYEECGKISKSVVNGKEMPVIEGSANMLVDPNWSQFWRIDISDIFKMDVIFPELILVSSENVIASGKSLRIDVRDGTLTIEQVKLFIKKFREEIKVLEDQKRNQEELMNKSSDKEEINEIKNNIVKIDEEIDKLNQQIEMSEKALNKNK